MQVMNMGIPKVLLVSLAALAVATAVTVSILGVPPTLPPGEADAATQPAAGGAVREFHLEVTPADIDMGDGLVWHAWTYNGQVPGPTLTANVGDELRVSVHNNHSLVHSFHTHLVPAGLASDGAQLNTITGIGGMAMIPPGGTYTYTLKATVPGINYYHCHSADGNHTISQHMAQGLYGAILIKDPAEKPIRTEVVFMGERGFNVSSPEAPYFVMNGHGLPGGEHKLEEVFAKQGVPGVVAQLGKTVPLLTGRVGEPIELAIVNIGDAVHSFHLHGMTAISQEQQPGHVVPAQVVQLVPGAVDRIRLTPTDPGLWLFHCHVVTHADQGMIGVFLVDPEEGSLDLPAPAQSDAHASHGAAPADPADEGNVTEVTIRAGQPGELTFTAPHETLPVGTLKITFVNDGRAPHSLSFPQLDIQSGTVPGGGSKVMTVRVDEPGVVEFLCAEPGHAGAGMKGSLTVA